MHAAVDRLRDSYARTVVNPHPQPRADHPIAQPHADPEPDRNEEPDAPLGSGFVAIPQADRAVAGSEGGGGSD
jgi:hypothetical protein